ncbi:MAG: AzlC family ABC transporter permease [Eubacterium sp.]|nr:AzlC family ABC transporter permease [Eubacterium sp.]
MMNYKSGLRAGIPIALGYLSVSFTFGILATRYGLSVWQATLVSLTTVTSAGQFAGIQLMATPGLYLDMLASQLTINVRYSFMSISLSQKLDNRFRGIWKWILGFFVTDEIFAVAVSRPVVTRSFFAGLSTLPWIGWTLGTAFGASMGEILPASILSALGLALYGMFVAIVVPPAKDNRYFLLAVGMAAAISTAFAYIPFLKQISSGIAISIAAVVAAVIAAIVHPIEDEPAGDGESPAPDRDPLACHPEESPGNEESPRPAGNDKEVTP